MPVQHEKRPSWCGCPTSEYGAPTGPPHPGSGRGVNPDHEGEVPDDTASQQHRRGHPTATDPFSPARLRGHLDGLGLSCAEIAARIGHTEADLASYENGAAQPSPQVLAALAAVLSITVYDLHQKRDDWAADYVDTVAVYCQPETDAELDAVAAALRRLDAIVDRHRRATAAAVTAAPDPEPARPATPALGHRASAALLRCSETPP